MRLNAPSGERPKRAAAADGIVGSPAAASVRWASHPWNITYKCLMRLQATRIGKARASAAADRGPQAQTSRARASALFIPLPTRSSPATSPPSIFRASSTHERTTSTASPRRGLPHVRSRPRARCRSPGAAATCCSTPQAAIQPGRRRRRRATSHDCSAAQPPRAPSRRPPLWGRGSQPDGLSG